MVKKIVTTIVLLVMIFSLCACGGEKDYGVKPSNLNDLMPEIWEETVEGLEFDYSVFDLSASSEITEITIGKDITIFNFQKLSISENLENIYVEEGNKAFVSDDGVLYSKTYLTLYKWPAKKPVTSVRKTVKYFAPSCFYYCDMPDDFEIPDGTVSIGNAAFAATDLTKIHIKKNVKFVGEGVFGGANELNTVEISAPIAYLNFFGYGKNIIFNKGVKQIRAVGDTFDEHRLTHIESIKFPDTLQAIGNVCFPVNVRVEKYTMPKNIIFIDQYAFTDAHYRVKNSLSAEELEDYLAGNSKISWIRVARKAETEFDCKSAYIKGNIDARMFEWQNNRDKGYNIFEGIDFEG